MHICKTNLFSRKQPPDGKRHAVSFRLGGTLDSPNVSPRRIFFEIGFPLFPYQIKRGEHRISLSPNAVPIKPAKTYTNPLFLALRYKHLLETPGIGSQAKLALKMGVSPARVNQILRLLKLPPDIQQSVIRMGDSLHGRKITERKLRALLNSTRPE